MTQQEEVARQLWEEAGKPEGRDDEFWFAAEKILAEYEKSWENYSPDCSEADTALWNVIWQGLADCIRAHGPIKERFLGSATKRVVRGIVENEDFRRVCPEDVHNKMIVSSLKRHYDTLLEDLIRYRDKKLGDRRNLGSEIKKLREEIGKLQKAQQKKREGWEQARKSAEKSQKELQAQLLKKDKEIQKLIEDADDEKHAALKAEIKKLKSENAQLTNKNLVLSRQVASWRVLAEGPPKEVKEMPVEEVEEEKPLPRLVLPCIPAITVRS